MDDPLILHHHEIGGPPTDVHDGDGDGEPLLIQCRTPFLLNDHVVIPGGQGFWDHLMKGDGRGQSAVYRLRRLFETGSLFFQSLVALISVPEIEGTDRQAGDGVEGMASQPRLLQGMLDVKQQVANGIQERFDLETLGEQRVAQAVENQVVRLHGKDYDIAPLVRSAKQQVVERIHAETRRQLGLGVELDRILFVGGGTVALAEDIANWFPNQAIAEHPAFANARGMLKYLRYVCEASDAA